MTATKQGCLISLSASFLPVSSSPPPRASQDMRKRWWGKEMRIYTKWNEEKKGITQGTEMEIVTTLHVWLDIKLPILKMCWLYVDGLCCLVKHECEASTFQNLELFYSNIRERSSTTGSLDLLILSLRLSSSHHVIKLSISHCFYCESVQAWPECVIVPQRHVTTRRQFKL